MALIPSQILRVAILLSYFSILCNYKAIDMPAHQTYGGSWKFLTFIDLVIQAVFFGVCVLTDLSSLLTKGSASMEQERQLRKLIGLRDWMMAVLAFPVGVFVVTMFWALYLYDRDLVYPRLLDNFIPQWLNHGMDLKRPLLNFHGIIGRQFTCVKVSVTIIPSLLCDYSAAERGLSEERCAALMLMPVASR
ncbi:Androgen-induced gene 1 protein [Anabarilius grahami]|uniref:Androgen-induced gene 1 protein n=1 Tax=Anabarilius grahami TaxID=495550 RepID=A0A3N0Z599_ANAGA|nr:Androgen-induced gene 1 protein [Anabarilius grahami]